MKCKHHPEYDPASGEPTATIDCQVAHYAPCPYCWQARAKVVTEKMRLSNLAASSLETENKQLQERIAELEGQLAKEKRYRQYWKDSPDKAWAEMSITKDELRLAEKREAVLREALVLYAGQCTRCNGSGRTQNTNVSHFEIIDCDKCKWARAALEGK